MPKGIYKHTKEQALKGVETRRKNGFVSNIGKHWKIKDVSNYIGNKNALGHVVDEETKKKISVSKTGVKQTEQHIKNALRRREKSSLELKFETIINKYNLPFKFVGNGEFFIERKCPDFINEDKKIAIEVYYTRHKEFCKGGINQWIIDRTEIFERNGWKILFFNEKQVIYNDIINKLNARSI